MPEVAKTDYEKIRAFTSKFKNLEIVTDKLYCKICEIEVYTCIILLSISSTRIANYVSVA